MEQRHKRIQHWDDERSIGNSLIVTLIPGWKFSADELANEHVRGFDTVAEAMREVRSAVPCDCDQCKRPRRLAPTQRRSERA